MEILVHKFDKLLRMTGIRVEKMTTAHQQAIVIFFGGALIWIVAIGLSINPWIVKKEKSIRIASTIATIVGALGGISYLLLVWVFQTRISELAPQVPGIVIGVVAFMIVAFLGVLWKTCFYDRLGQWLQQRVERKRENTGTNSK